MRLLKEAKARALRLSKARAERLRRARILAAKKKKWAAARRAARIRAEKKAAAKRAAAARKRARKAARCRKKGGWSCRKAKGYGGVVRVYGKKFTQKGVYYQIDWPIVKLKGTNQDGVSAVAGGCGDHDGKRACTAICHSLTGTSMRSGWVDSALRWDPHVGYPAAANNVANHVAWAADSKFAENLKWGRANILPSRMGRPMRYCQCDGKLPGSPAAMRDPNKSKKCYKFKLDFMKVLDQAERFYSIGHPKGYYRNKCIVYNFEHRATSVKTLQGMSNRRNQQAAAAIITLKAWGYSTKRLKGFTENNQRNTLITKANKCTKKSVKKLQKKTTWQIVKLINKNIKCCP
jgi:hypothetical protein